MAPKYMLSDDYYSYYIYGKTDDFPAYCAGNDFPKYYANGEWRNVRFLEFADNAIRITRKQFLKLLTEKNVPLPEELRK